VPVHPPEATQESAAVALHASVVPLPSMTLLGFGAIEITGLTATFTLLPLCDSPNPLEHAARAMSAPALIVPRNERIMFADNDTEELRLNLSRRKLPTWLSAWRPQRITCINCLLTSGVGQQSQAPLNFAMT